MTKCCVCSKEAKMEVSKIIDSIENPKIDSNMGGSFGGIETIIFFCLEHYLEYLKKEVK